ncbi:MAG TPA: LytTR family DNA-binding domain-containing protein [Gemmatimonadales bacterium]|nr:LytTR family DNA-binding domain-containing protein [Gemmatimonadales bacterium]
MTSPIRVLIADDEPAARRTIQLLLADDPEFQILGECSDGLQTVEAINQLHPDLVFLDVQMPRRDGFEVLARMPPGCAPLIVFVTAYDEYTLRAFDVHAADYLLKPFSDQRFRAAAAHAKERIRQRSAGDLERLLSFVRQLGSLASTPAKTVPDRVPIRTTQGVLLVPLDDIDWVEARGDYVRVHSTGRTDLVRETISGFERRLPASRFIRIHRSTIVNLDKVREIKLMANGEHVAVLQSGIRCRLSRSGRERLAQQVSLFSDQPTTIPRRG